MRSGILIMLVAAAVLTITAAAAADNCAPAQVRRRRPTAPPANPARRGCRKGAVAAALGDGDRRRDAHGILGRDVRSSANEDMGRIVDVIVDRDGNVRAAVIDFGGFLGVGSRKIVVDWNALRFGRRCQQERQHHARTEQGAGERGAGIQGGYAADRAGRRRQSASMGIRALGRRNWSRVRTLPSTDRIGDDRRRAISRRHHVVPLVRRVGPAPEQPRAPSRQSQRGLDWFIFFLADVQTGFGPFIAVYLTTQKWTQVEIGFVLSIGGIIGLLGQMPGGAIVDAARSRSAVVAGLRGRRDRIGRAGLCAVADLSRGDARRDAARACELRAGTGDRRDQPRPGRAAWRSASGSAATRASPRSAAARPRR